MKNIQRCDWGSGELLVEYRGLEWEDYLRDDRLFLEFL